MVLLPAHHHQYSKISRHINQIYQEYTDLVEPFGIDESWLDVTGSLHLFGGDPQKLADTLRERIRHEFGITISVGISFNKIFAKLGSDYKKPDATTLISRENFKEIVWPLPVNALLYVGRSALQTFHRFGILTIGDLAQFNRDALVRLLGKNGAQCHDFANGFDCAPVAPFHLKTQPKSVGNGLTFPHNLRCKEEIHSGIVLLSDQVAARLRQCGLKCSGICITIRAPDFRDLSRQQQISSPTNLAREISQIAITLAHQCWNMDHPVRAITITALYLLPEQEVCAQQDLFSSEHSKKREKLERLENTLDQIRSKYGKSAIASASSPIDLRTARHASPPGGQSNTD